MSSATKHFKCGVCFEPFDDANGPRAPKSLKCGHTWCAKCLLKMVENSDVKCGHCRKITTLTDGSVDSLPTNFIATEKVQVLLPTPSLCAQHNWTICSYCTKCRTVLCLQCFTQSHKKCRNLVVDIQDAYKSLTDKLRSNIGQYDLWPTVSEEDYVMFAEAQRKATVVEQKGAERAAQAAFERQIALIRADAKVALDRQQQGSADFRAMIQSYMQVRDVTDTPPEEAAHAQVLLAERTHLEHLDNVDRLYNRVVDASTITLFQPSAPHPSFSLASRLLADIASKPPAATVLNLDALAVHLSPEEKDKEAYGPDSGVIEGIIACLRFHKGNADILAAALRAIELACFHSWDVRHLAGQMGAGGHASAAMQSEAGRTRADVLVAGCKALYSIFYHNDAACRADGPEAVAALLNAVTIGLNRREMQILLSSFTTLHLVVKDCDQARQAAGSKAVNLAVDYLSALGDVQVDEWVDAAAVHQRVLQALDALTRTHNMARLLSTPRCAAALQKVIRSHPGLEELQESAWRVVAKMYGDGCAAFVPDGAALLVETFRRHASSIRVVTAAARSLRALCLFGKLRSLLHFVLYVPGSVGALVACLRQHPDVDAIHDHIYAALRTLCDDDRDGSGPADSNLAFELFEAKRALREAGLGSLALARNTENAMNVANIIRAPVLMEQRDDDDIVEVTPL